MDRVVERKLHIAGPTHVGWTGRHCRDPPHDTQAPRTWGWTAEGLKNGGGRGPTHVGMDREAVALTSNPAGPTPGMDRAGSPEVRQAPRTDGPLEGHGFLSQAPRTWMDRELPWVTGGGRPTHVGWTRWIGTGSAGPTHVGMDQGFRGPVIRAAPHVGMDRRRDLEVRRPHARGMDQGTGTPTVLAQAPAGDGPDHCRPPPTPLQAPRRDGPAMSRAGSDGGSQAWERHQTWQHRGGTPMSCANAPPVWSWKPARTRPHETEQSPAPRTSSASTARPCATGWSRPRSMPETGPAPPPTRPNAWPSWSAKCTSCAGPTRS